MELNTNCSRLYHKHCSKSILPSPTVSRIQITREPRNSEYLLNVNNTQQKDKNLTRVPSILLYLQLALESLALVHSVQQKHISLKFSKSRTRIDFRYNCHHNSSLLLSPYLRIYGVSLSSIHYTQSHHIYIN